MYVRGLGPMSALAEGTKVYVAAAAGALNSNGMDITLAGVAAQRGRDTKTSTRLLSEAQSREMWTRQTLLPLSPRIKRLELARALPRVRAREEGCVRAIHEYRGARCGLKEPGRDHCRLRDT